MVRLSRMLFNISFVSIFILSPQCIHYIVTETIWQVENLVDFGENLFDNRQESQKIMCARHLFTGY